ncbi:MAG: family 16 glycosylhydrolase [Bacteroidota bacterium]
MKKSVLICLAVGFFSCLSRTALSQHINEEQSYTLIWSDEFTGSGAPDTENWFHQSFAPNNGSWFNGEEQHYTDRIENSIVEDGVLKIIARRETFNNGQSTKNYTSARMNSKYTFTYGRVDVRAKLPIGRGTWPAIWTLGQNINETGAYWQTQGFGTTNWPATGEIDIMEHWGDSPDIIHWSNHTPAGFGGNPNTNKATISNVSSEFHKYSIIWNEDEIRYLVDDVTYHVYNPVNKNDNNWPFDKPQYLLLNVAMGGIYQSEPRVIDPNFTESTMEIDYVRIYEETIPFASDARLKDLQVDGETIQGFNPNRADYTFFLTGGQSEIPQISYTTNAINATVTLAEATSVPGTTTIEVASEDGSSSNTYSIEFKRSLQFPLDFESSEIAFTLQNFDGGVGEVVTNPIKSILNTSDHVVKYTKFPGATFAGTTLSLDQPLDFSNGSLVKTKVLSPRIGVPLTLKLESPTGSNEFVSSNLKVNEWDIITFDISGFEKGDYNAITLIWENGTVGDGSANWIFFMDDFAITDQLGKVSTLAEVTLNDSIVTVFDPEVLDYRFTLSSSVVNVPRIGIKTTDEVAFQEIKEASQIPGTTTVEVIAEDGIAATTYNFSFVYDEITLGLEREEVFLYPNPVKDELFIRHSGRLDYQFIQLFDLQGKRYFPQVSLAENNEIRLDISSLSSGTYILRFDAEMNKLMRFVKQ